MISAKSITATLSKLNQDNLTRLQQQLEVHQAYANVTGSKVDTHLLQYVKAKLNGQPAKPLTKHRRLNGKVTVRKVSLEEMEKLWK